MLTCSLEDGVPSQGRVRTVLKAVSARPTAELKPLLLAYARLMRRHEFLRTLSIERAGALAPASREAVVKAMAGGTGRALLVTEKESPELIAGLRVRLGDDVFDASLAGALTRMGQSQRHSISEF